jgi:tetratricopeptide (TPR) repeat protein
MAIQRHCLMTALCLCTLMTACGPETIILKSGLDTPSHHVANGDTLLKSGKLTPAYQEYLRAQELEPNYAPALVGLGIIYGHRGELEKAREMMERARSVARGDDERQAVSEGFEFLETLSREQPAPPSQ